jgi:hypothetical protein
LDFTGLGFSTSEELNVSLTEFMSEVAGKDNLSLVKTALSDKFRELIEKLHQFYRTAGSGVG